MFVHALMRSADFHLTDYAPPKDLQEGYKGLCRVRMLFPSGRCWDLGYYEWFDSPLNAKSLMALGPSTRRSGWVQNVFGDFLWYRLRSVPHCRDNEITCLDDEIETVWGHEEEVVEIFSDEEVEVIEISSDEEEK